MLRILSALLEPLYSLPETFSALYEDKTLVAKGVFVWIALWLLTLLVVRSKRR